MISKAGQTVGPNGADFFVETLLGGQGCNRLNEIDFFFNFFFHGQRWALQLVFNKARHSYICCQ